MIKVTLETDKAIGTASIQRIRDVIEEFLEQYCSEENLTYSKSLVENPDLAVASFVAAPSYPDGFKE